MKKEKIALLAPFISLLALIAIAIAAFLKAIQAIGLYTPSNPDALTWTLQLGAAIAVLGLAVYAAILPEKTRQLLTGKKLRYGSNLFVLSLAFLGILGSLNYLAYKNPIKWDLTAEKKHTLAPESVEILDALPEKVEAIAFFSAAAPMGEAERLLLDFKAGSKGKFDYQFVDPDLNPVEARNAGITGDGKILLKMGDRQEIVPAASEQELLRGLLRLLNPNERVIYFLTGHGEYDTELPGERAVTRALNSLYGKNYTVLTLNLRAENAVPNDALALITVGATVPLSEEEIALLDAYLANGGGLVALIDPTPLSGLPAAENRLAAYLRKTWGLRLDDDFVVDPSSNPPSDVVAYRYAAHPITDKMNNIVSYFPFVRSTGIDEKEQLIQAPLVWTIDRAWGETDFSALEAEGEAVSFDETEDLAGPLALACAAEDPASHGRVVLFGNAVFAGDEAFDAYGNGDLFINAVDWAAEQENLLNLTPRKRVERTFLVPNDFQLIAILLGSVCLLPGVMVLGGFLAWMKRRKRG